MRLSTISIKNFRGIKECLFDLSDMNFLVGDNGTGKTSVLEAIHYCLSPYYLSGKIKATDFYQGGDEHIEIDLTFDSAFVAKVPDGYGTKDVECNKIVLDIKKRERATPGKAFSDLVTISHYAHPNRNKDNADGWEIIRGTGSKFKFNERQLSLSRLSTDGLMRSFYFGKRRDRQIKKGYNSSISSVFDDFDWRFLKNIRKGTPVDDITFQESKNKLVGNIMDSIDDAVYDKTFKKVNDVLLELGMDSIDIGFIDSLAPFSNASITSNVGSIDLSISDSGSGVEMIVSLIFLETLASLSNESIAIIIDEPELHLHPKLQQNLCDYLYTLSSGSTQIICSTHSPYFFRKEHRQLNSNILITTKEENDIQIIPDSNISTLSWGPTWGAINYYAYSLPTVEFHDELYGHLQDKYEKRTIPDFDNYLEQQGIPKDKARTEERNGEVRGTYDTTLQTFIRHKLHHPENVSMRESVYTQSELKKSIESMLPLI